MKHEWVKLYEGLLRSSLWWDLDAVTLKVFIGCVLISDTKGRFTGTDKALAATFNVSIEDFRRAMKALMAPDPNSTTKTEGGRRIVSPEPNVYFVVNKRQYNTEAEPPGASTDRVKKFRARKQAGASVPGCGDGETR